MNTANAPLRICVVGAGWMGRFHAEAVARRIPGLELSSIVDPRVDETRTLADELGAHGRPVAVHADAAEALADADALLIAAPPHLHPGLITAAAAARIPVFCEKPGALEPAPLIAAVAAMRSADAPLQFGFNRRFDAEFAAAKRLIESGATGTPQLLRSLTRDPAPLDPATIKPHAIFIETLVHDFDALRWLGGSRAVDVLATADALIRPDARDAGLLDTAVVVLRYESGAIGIAEASLETNYGYDVRAEVFGPGGMVQAGGPPTGPRATGAAGATRRTWQRNIELFDAAYLAELTAFRDLVLRWRGGLDAAAAMDLPDGRLPGGDGRLPDGDDAIEALVTAHAAIRSLQTGQRVALADIPRA